MKITGEFFDGAVKLFQGHRLEDSRGHFERVFCEGIFEDYSLRQSNISFTKEAHSFRGFHFQYPPHCEDKILRCISGRILDIVIDLRAGSPTFLKHKMIELDASLPQSLLIPKGFAHGFQTLTGGVSLLYFHSEFFSPKSDGRLNIRDPKLNIKLPFQIKSISEKDETSVFLDNSFRGI